MKKKFGIGLMCIMLLSGGCGKAKEEGVALGSENIQASETLVEETSEEPYSEMDLEQESEEVSEEAKTEEFETEEPDVAPAPMPEKPVYIAQEFLDLLEQILMGEADENVLEEMECSQVMTDEEMKAYADDPEVAEHIEALEEASRGGEFLKADGDNDGIEDLFVIRWGGTMGNSYRHFLKGQADGSFRSTCGTEGLTRQISFVRYNETVYLLEPSSNFGSKIQDSFIVSLYQEGKVLETLIVEREMETYEPNTVYCMAGYEETAAKYEKEGRNGFWQDARDAFNGWGYVYAGTAETDVEWEDARDTLGLGEDFNHTSMYRCDLDNDGEQEWYWKRLFETTVYYASSGLDEALYEKGKEEASILETYGFTYEGFPLFFWVDSIGGKQVLFLLCYKDLDKEMLYGYLIEGDEAATVLEIDYMGVPVIDYRIYTKGINYDRDPWSPKG